MPRLSSINSANAMHVMIEPKQSESEVSIDQARLHEKYRPPNERMFKLLIMKLFW